MNFFYCVPTAFFIEYSSDFLMLNIVPTDNDVGDRLAGGPPRSK
jgi:hypothetical protein